MSRTGYSDDGEYLALWRGNVERTIAGKRGQAFFAELVQALEALPEKRLIQHSLQEGAEVCALGALGLKRGTPMAGLDPEDPEQVGKAFGISSMLAQEVVYMNDEQQERQTPEERWARMLDWARSELRTQTHQISARDE